VEGRRPHETRDAFWTDPHAQLAQGAVQARAAIDAAMLRVHETQPLR
jgi:hypothetical protein